MIVSREELKDIIAKLRKEGKKIATTNGAFDILHIGHLKSLEFAKRYGDTLIVGINSDESIKRYKSKDRPIISQDDRARLVDALSLVDYVTIFDEKTPEKLLEIIRPDFHIKGSEYKDNIPEQKTVEKYGGKIVFIERDPKDISTSMIIKKVKENGTC
ncbi:MAG: adenylyltransferase/cytidyltransferase family protein [Candidatus Woesearchaeota archaeon]|nr:adenylyltransferase/cytidyltransferase family protein [Candidatus Woesearchaeota archaeon]